MAPGAARWPALIWAPSKAGPVGTARGKEPVTVPEDDLGIRADVDDERHGLGLVRLLGEDDSRGVGADVAGDAWQHVDPGAWVGTDAELRRGEVDRGVGRQRERRRAERRRVDAQEQVMHDRVADDRELQDLGALDAGTVAQRREQPVERLAHGGRHLARALVVHHRVRDPAHEVFAVADLRVHDPGAGEDRAVGQVGQMPGDRGRSDIDRDAERTVVEARPDRDELVAAVDRDRDPVVTGRERRLESLHDREVRPQVVQPPLAGQGVEQPAQIAGRRGEVRRHDIDRVQADDRIEHEGSGIEVLAHDLAVDLALGRDVDHGIAEQVDRARQAPVGGQGMLGAVGRLQLRGRGKVVGRGGDPVLRERSEARGHGTATADPAPAADRVDVDAERTSRVEDGGPGLYPATSPRRGEDDLRVGGGRVAHRGR